MSRSYGSSAAFGSSVASTRHPLVALYNIPFVPDQAMVTIEFGPDTNYGMLTSFQLPPEGGGPVMTLVAGMRANSTYHMRARVQMPDGSLVLDPDFPFTTGSLPSKGIPTVGVARNGVPNPGIELVNVIDGRQISTAFDLGGHPIWFYHNPADDQWGGYAMPIRPLENGNFLVNVINLFNRHFFPPHSALREVTLDGQAVQELDLAAMNVLLENVPTSKGTIVKALINSHDATRLSNGYTAVIALIANPPVPNVVGDALIVLDEAFKPVWVWSAFDWLDVNRNPWGGEDWTHCNAIVETPDGNLLLSSRAQSWILKLDYQGGSGDGHILWKMGPEGDFTLTGSTDPRDWFYDQHCPIVLETSGENIARMSVFDNGNKRPDTQQPYSRGLILDVDEVNRAVYIDFDYRPAPPNSFSYWGGNVDPLDNGNIEIDISAPVNQSYSLVLEVTPDGSEIVWQMEVSPNAVYRAFRLPSLYFGVQWP